MATCSRLLLVAAIFLHHAQAATWYFLRWNTPSSAAQFQRVHLPLSFLSSFFPSSSSSIQKPDSDYSFQCKCQSQNSKKQEHIISGLAYKIQQTRVYINLYLMGGQGRGGLGVDGVAVTRIYLGAMGLTFVSPSSPPLVSPYSSIASSSRILKC
jgi:hypothetical protein